MIIATLLRYTRMEEEEPFDKSFYLDNHFIQMAKKFDVALLPLNTETSLATICTLCSGLIIPGSAIDVNPSYYGKPATVQEVDEYVSDRKIIEIFSKQGKPMLGVCGGMQELNVYFGGTLKKDVPNHRRVEHSVSFSSGSFLKKIYSVASIKTNSFHSQALDEIAPFFNVVAKAGDGTIEAIQSKTGSVFGVQWHPETDFSIPDTDFSGVKIFEYFLQQCRDS